MRERNLQNQVASLLAKERACQKNHQDFLRLEQEVTRLRDQEEHHKWDLEQMREQLTSLQQQLDKSQLKNSHLETHLAASRSGGLGQGQKENSEVQDEYAEEIPSSSVSLKKVKTQTREKKQDAEAAEFTDECAEIHS